VTVLLGLLALNYVEVSFTETIKSSAPAFTVLISRFLVGAYGEILVAPLLSKQIKASFS
jgi:hypothetical protein